MFLLTVPAWIVITKLYGLYDHDEERADHSTADDFGGVFHMVTVGHGSSSWSRISVTSRIRLRRRLSCSGPPQSRSSARPGRSKSAGAPERGLRPEHGHRRRGRGRPVVRAESPEPSGVRDQSRRVRRCQAEERRNDLEGVALLGTQGDLPAIVRLLDVERVIIAFSNDSHEETLELLRSLQDLEVQIDIVPRLFEIRRPWSRDPYGRGSAARRPAAAPALALVPPAEAGDGRRAHDPRACSPRTCSSHCSP